MKLLLDNPSFSSAYQVEHAHRLLFMGSCFADTVGAYFKERKFTTLQNPFGILYNPISIANCLTDILQCKEYNYTDFYKQEELISSWSHHSSISTMSETSLKEKLDALNRDSHEYLKKTDIIFITLGSAWTFFHKGLGRVVANNHKAPNHFFEKKLLTIQEISSAINTIVDKLRQLNADIKIVWTLSPVRHSKQGLTDNNLSKARLLESIHSICQQDQMSSYFPSYEIILDVLRDYRFYEPDLVHPNRMATDYLWHYVENSLLSPSSRMIMNKCLSVVRASAHRIMHSETEQSKQFVAEHLEKISEIEGGYPYIDFDLERKYFESL